VDQLKDVLTTRGRAFVAAGITLALCGWALGFPDITRVGVLLLCLPLVTGVLARRQRASVRVERHLSPNRVSVDQPAMVTVLMENTGTRRTPLLLAEERLDYVLGDRPRFLLGRMAPTERRQVQYEVRAHLRGRRALGPLTVQLRDPFGLTARFAQIGGTSDIVVLPRIEALTEGRPPGDGVGAEGEIPHMVALHGEDDQSIREYRDGDDLRRIHWPATARTGDLMVRQEDRPARRRAVVVLDPRADGHRGSGTGSSFEWAVTAVASMVSHLAGYGYAIHLISSETVHDGQAAGTTEPDQALDILAEAATGPAHQLEELVRAAHQVTASGGLVIAVLADRDEEVLRQVASLRQPGSTGLAMVIDAATFADGRRVPSSGAAETFADVLQMAGWSAATVHSGHPVVDVWSALTTKGVLAR
jgi:uncharacterized protein (DUF58 family)